jgi:hypothetical protein
MELEMGSQTFRQLTQTLFQVEQETQEEEMVEVIREICILRKWSMV